MSQPSLKYILVVDLAEYLQQVIRHSLKHNANWQVILANSIIEGLALIKTRRPDLILLEASLLDNCHSNIWQQLKTIVSNHSIPLIFMAARVKAMDRFKFQQLGGIMAIAKPFDPKDLVETISQVLN
jgi:DNA-binding response OmpR family regulator